MKSKDMFKLSFNESSHHAIMTNFVSYINSNDDLRHVDTDSAKKIVTKKILNEYNGVVVWSSDVYPSYFIIIGVNFYTEQDLARFVLKFA